MQPAVIPSDERHHEHAFHMQGSFLRVYSLVYRLSATYTYTKVGSEQIFGTATNSSWITTPKSIGTRSVSEGLVAIMQAHQISDLCEIGTITDCDPDTPEFKIPAQ